MAHATFRAELFLDNGKQRQLRNRWFGSFEEVIDLIEAETQRYREHFLLGDSVVYGELSEV